ncbi:MAG: NusG domain II-containing protein [Hornefia sp.]|nr:NusG domain II-containing protein [Hornefia sp.]
MFRIIKKADIVLFLILVIIGAALFFVSATGNEKGKKAVVSVDGKLYGTYSLEKDQTIVIRHTKNINKFIIKDGYVQMVHANCSNKVCLKEGKISKTKQSIVCLPNKVVIEIRGGDSYDAVSQ